VLISDYHLDAKLTGLDVLQELRTRHARDVPAILLTGATASMLRAVKTPIPRCRFLSKPSTPAPPAAIQELTAELKSLRFRGTAGAGAAIRRASGPSQQFGERAPAFRCRSPAQ